MLVGQDLTATPRFSLTQKGTDCIHLCRGVSACHTNRLTTEYTYIYIFNLFWDFFVTVVCNSGYHLPHLFTSVFCYQGYPSQFFGRPNTLYDWKNDVYIFKFLCWQWKRSPDCSLHLATFFWKATIPSPVWHLLYDWCLFWSTWITVPQIILWLFLIVQLSWQEISSILLHI